MSHLCGRKLRRQLTGIVQKETISTIYLDVCAMVGTNYNLCPVGPKTKQNKNQQKSPTSQKKPLEGMQAVLGNRPIQTEVIKAALIFNTHPTVSPTVCPSFSLANQTGDLGNGRAI